VPGPARSILHNITMYMVRRYEGGTDIIMTTRFLAYRIELK